MPDSVRLRPAAVTVAVLALCVALAAMFHAGRAQRSVVLIALFTVWVASPFAAAILANVVSRRWPARVQKTLCYAAMFVSIASALFYAYASFGPGPWKAGFVFLVGPFVSWVVLLLGGGAAAAGSRA